MDTWSVAAPDIDMVEVKVSFRSLTESMESWFKEVNAKLSVQDTRNFCMEISSRQQVETGILKCRNSFQIQTSKWAHFSPIMVFSDLLRLSGNYLSSSST